MDIAGFLNQSAVYERFIEHNEWGDPVYAPAITIPVRKTVKSKMHRMTDRTTRINVGQILTNHPNITLQDRIDNEELQAVEEYVDISGTIIGYTCYPRPPVGYAN